MEGKYGESRDTLTDVDEVTIIFRAFILEPDDFFKKEKGLVCWMRHCGNAVSVCSVEFQTADSFLLPLKMFWYVFTTSGKCEIA